MKTKKRPVILTIVLLLLWICTLVTLGMTSSKAADQALVKAQIIKSTSDAIEINIKIPVVKYAPNSQYAQTLNRMLASKAHAFYEPLTVEAKKYLADTKKNPKLHFNKYSAFSTFKTSFNRKGILSIPLRNYQYTGGANGLEVQVGYNWNLKTGRTIRLSDLFAPGYDYQKALSSEVLKQMKANKATYFKEAITSFKQIAKDQPFYLEKGKLVLFYGPFEIAPHSSGIPEFRIPFSTLKLNPKLPLS